MIPRRIQVDKFTPAEKAIYDAQGAVEAMPADVRLTKAGTLLQQARDAVADFVDGVQPPEPKSPGVAERLAGRDVIYLCADRRVVRVATRDRPPTTEEINLATAIVCPTRLGLQVVKNRRGDLTMLAIDSELHAEIIAMEMKRVPPEARLGGHGCATCGDRHAPGTACDSVPPPEPKPLGDVEHIMQFFVWAHLPPQLAEVSRPFAEIAHTIVETLPRNPERTVALRKLLEAKDAAVRARVAK